MGYTKPIFSNTKLAEGKTVLRKRDSKVVMPQYKPQMSDPEARRNQGCSTERY
jgi:hypothetical protein